MHIHGRKTTEFRLVQVCVIRNVIMLLSCCLDGNCRSNAVNSIVTEGTVTLGSRVEASFSSYWVTYYDEMMVEEKCFALCC